MKEDNLGLKQFKGDYYFYGTSIVCDFTHSSSF